MKCARCLLQLRPLGPLGQSAWPAAHCVSAQLRSASCNGPTGLQQSQNQVLRRFHSSPVCTKSQPAPAEQQQRDKSVVSIDDLFERVSNEAKVKDTFSKVLDGFIRRDARRRGHVEFIYAALKKMPEFGVERDIAVYNKLLDVFPKEVFVPRNFIQLMFNHYPRQQECGVQVLQQMESYGVMPNIETKVLLVQIFGEKSHPIRKYQRIMYWFPRFKHVNPFPLPQQLPDDPVELSYLSLSRIANDLSAKITVYQHPCTDVGENGEEITLPHIVGVQSPDQMELLAKHNPNRPVFVEGPFPLWLKKKCVHYYVLRADPVPPEEKVEEPYDPERSFYYPLQLDLDLDRDFGDYETFDVDDVDEGPVFAMCMTSQGDQVTLNQWISGLQLNNPMLGQVPTLFRLNAGPQELQESGAGSALEQQREEPQNEPQPEVLDEDEEEPQKRQAMKP